MNHRNSKLLWCLTVAAYLPGCNPQAKSPPSGPPAITATETKSEPGVVELSDPKVTPGDDNLIKIEFHYRFTSGSPVKTYLLEMSFPGTNERGQKAMEGWELKPEGVIKTAVQVGDPKAVTKYSIVMSEADSPDRGYTRNSNELTGELESLDSESSSP
ncbi:hypothetical protein Pan44_50370 [Caulifigura coniformis]|uniref:Uncharacterized protein n=1 Tax=Caulifigura coniformis TaxID=2527983 RepID=A0A517SLH6_9PLAN|nr:hypothetical protein [Caulifigura coniformis]QDT56974.1 hypothetical protein Pan44_50370 [Caulifigura coniformis]